MTSTVTADEDIVVQAGYEGDPDDPGLLPTIYAWALAADLGGGVSSGFNATLAGSGSGAHNTVNSTIEAVVTNDSSLTSQEGDIQVLAFDFTTVDAWTVGASLGAGGSSGASLQGAVGVSLAKNDVTRTIRAAVMDSVLVASGTGEITVRVHRRCDDPSGGSGGERWYQRCQRARSGADRWRCGCDERGHHQSASRGQQQFIDSGQQDHGESG